MAHVLKYSSSGRMKISAGYKPGNMAAFMYGSTKRKRKKRVRGKCIKTEYLFMFYQMARAVKQMMREEVR